ncbi:MAG: phosphatase PAP2 family protein [Bacillota bacterium]
MFLFRMINGLAERSVWVDRLAKGLTLAGWGGIIWILIALLMLGLGWDLPAWRLAAIAAMALLALMGGLDTAIKLLFQRLRPPFSLPDARLLLPLPGSYSFLSGHTLSSVATALFLALAFQRLGAPGWTGPAVLVLAAGIGWSRIHVGHHYPFDVLAGGVVGAGLGWLAWRLAEPLIEAARLT